MQSSRGTFGRVLPQGARHRVEATCDVGRVEQILHGTQRERRLGHHDRGHEPSGCFCVITRLVREGQVTNCAHCPLEYPKALVLPGVLDELVMLRCRFEDEIVLFQRQRVPHLIGIGECEDLVLREPLALERDQAKRLRPPDNVRDAAYSYVRRLDDGHRRQIRFHRPQAKICGRTTSPPVRFDARRVFVRAVGSVVRHGPACARSSRSQAWSAQCRVTASRPTTRPGGPARRPHCPKRTPGRGHRAGGP